MVGPVETLAGSLVTLALAHLVHISGMDGPIADFQLTLQRASHALFWTSVTLWIDPVGSTRILIESIIEQWR